MRKNGCVTIGNTGMYYAVFGEGLKKLAVLPGLSDGLATVKGLEKEARKKSRETKP